LHLEKAACVRCHTDRIAGLRQHGLSEKGTAMAQSAQIVGKVEYRGGDGPAVAIREGPVEVSLSASDATLSWVEEEAHGSAAMPIGDFRRYVKEGKIRLDGPLQAEDSTPRAAAA
jgi:hypothetical protein